MNKRKIIILIIILTVTFIMGIITINKSKTRELKVNDNRIAIMVQNENDDGYHLWDKDTWPLNGYAFEKGTCNNGENIEWDAEHQLVTLSGKKTDKCTLYFQLAPKSLGDAIKELIENGNEVESNKGYLYLHDTTLANGAEDGGYRYAGNQPNNYICFGSGSEEYNNGTDTECPLTNKYRIIGLVPVITSEGKEETLVKIIKAEYITAEELGISASGTVNYDPKTSKNKRIQHSATNIPGFYWNDSGDNTWEGSSLYNALNNETTGYLKFLYGNNKTNWENKIETVKWNVGGWNKSSVTPKAMYDAEMLDGGCYEDNCNDYPEKQGSGTTVDAKIGLMYGHDYGFASIEDSWTSAVSNYNNNNGSNKNRENNWLFNGVYEWTISRKSNGSGTYFVNSMGSLTLATNVKAWNGVRPVLYLKSDVKLGAGTDIDGGQSKPYKVS